MPLMTGDPARIQRLTRQRWRQAGHYQGGGILGIVRHQSHRERAVTAIHAWAELIGRPFCVLSFRTAAHVEHNGSATPSMIESEANR
jgi:hypothetical protein